MKSRLLKSRAERALPLFLSFLLPFVIAGLAFAISGLYPFGDRQIFVNDGWHQYYPFLVAFRSKLLNGGSLQYDWTVGMGSNYLSIFAYYLSSPLYLLSALVPLRWLREFYALMTVLKLGLAGLFFGVYLRLVYRKNDLTIPFFSILYALCAWAGGYYWNIIWLDAFALLPLLIAGTVALLRDGRFRLYILALALTLWCNYYVGFFCCIFVLLSFCGYCICCWSGIRNFLRRFVRIGVCTLIGAGIAAVLLIPTLAAMQGTYSSAAKEFSPLALNIAENASGLTTETRGIGTVLKEETLPGILEALQKILGNALPANKVTSMSGLPNIYCGFGTLVLAIAFCCNRKIRLREKLFQVGLLVFLLLSFVFRILDYIWHGFHFPNMLPYRFSFLFSFVLISMAYRFFTQIDGFKKWHLAIIVPVSLLLLVNGYFAPDCRIYSVIAAAVALVGVAAALLIRAPQGIRRSVSTFLFCLLFLGEMGLGFGLAVSNVGTTSRSAYPLQNSDMQSLIQYMNEHDSDLFWRAETTGPYTLNEAALNGYNGVSVFTSSANVNFNRFSGSLGLASWPGSNRYVYYESSPFTNTLCGIKYLFDRTGNQYDTDYTTPVAESGNVKLLRSSTYIAPGFMTDAALGDFLADKGVYNPIREQESMFTLATGIDAPLYTHIRHSDLSCSDNSTLIATGTSGTQYSYTLPDDPSDEKLRISYTLPQDGVYCATTNTTCTKKVSVYCNDTLLFSRDLKVRSLFTLGHLNEGDRVTFEYSDLEHKGTAVSLDLAVQNNDVFDEGFALLADEPLVLTKWSDTQINGTIEVKQDGLFYTSIPYERGWRVIVDGREISVCEGYDPKLESVKLSDSVICFPLSKGSHTIELRFTAPGLKAGAIISGISLAVFAALLILLRKKPVILPELPYRSKRRTETVEAVGASEALETDTASDDTAQSNGASDDIPSDSSAVSEAELERILAEFRQTDVPVDDDVESEQDADEPAEKPE